MREKFEKSKLVLAFSNTEFADKIFWLDCVDSTNVYASKLLSEKVEAPFVVVAREQNAGKGRLSRKWYAEPDATLCMSVVVPAPLDSTLIRSFTTRVATSVCSALEKKLATKLYIKWPNDIYSAQGKKIAGMLTELKIDATKKSIILGIGINCFRSENPVDKSIEETIGILEDSTTQNFSMCDIAKIVALAILETAQAKSTENLAMEFSRYDWLSGKDIQIDIGSSVLSGIASGVADNGELLLKLDTGEIKQIAGLEASIIKK